MKGKGIKMVDNGFGGERFVASLLALTPFGSYNKRVCGSVMLIQMPSAIRKPANRYTKWRMKHLQKEKEENKLCKNYRYQSKSISASS